MEPRPQIARLAAAVVSTAGARRNRSLLYVGWTDDELPAASASAEALSEDARRAVAAYRGAGLHVPQLPYGGLVPVEYVLTGPAVDFADTRAGLAEDQIRYTVLDAEGTRREIEIGELTVLAAIAAARVPWQDLAAGAGTELTVSAVPLYTLFAGLPGLRADLGLALLFRPTIRGATNEAAFRAFVRNTIGRLLVLDESQPPGARKGYLDAAGEVAGQPEGGGFLETLVWLRRLGFVEFSDDWLAGLRRAGHRAQGTFLRALRAVGMVDVSDEMLAELTNPRPDYDVDRLDLDRLVDLAAAMEACARSAMA